MKQPLAQPLTFLQYLRKLLRHPKAYLRSAEGRFTRIYRENRWRDQQSKSGPGSNLPQTAAIRRQLPGLLTDLGARTMLDIPCGDFNWMREANLQLEQYIGGDIVEELIQENQRLYGNEQRSFRKFDLTRDELPRADVVLCRDCLVHLSFADGLRALERVRASKAGFLLSTTFVDVTNNADIITGDWRSINLQLPPYNLPEPVRMIDEECPEPKYRDKRLGVWELIPVISAAH